MDFVFALHSHLPYVLNHGRWPHGSDWLCEAAIDTYLPLIETLTQLAREDVHAPVTIGVTPVLGNQLAHPSFAAELEHLFAERLKACARAPAELAETGQDDLIPLAAFWHTRLERLRRLFRTHGDIIAALRRFESGGRLEIISSAATHGYLPLLGTEASIRLQLHVGYAEHRRLFGRAPRGCWLPECAYRPRGPWPVGGSRAPERPGIEEHLAAVGFRYFFTDSHLAAAGTPLGAYHDVPLGAERFDAERHGDVPAKKGGQAAAPRSPYWSYRVSAPGAEEVRAFVRDPHSSMQVWSRDRGYPGDEWYLEFHKIRWPGGLKLWRVTGPGVDLGGKLSYAPDVAESRASEHARHFTHVLEGLAAEHATVGDVIVAPFDTELFGHWWFEGIPFIADLYRALARVPSVRPVTGTAHLRRHPRPPAIRLSEGSWGANGDHSMWLNDGTRWTWDRLWPLEQRFWQAARAAIGIEALRPVVAQAAREMLLAQSSDWQFVISTGAAADYAERRFVGHCEAAEGLIEAMESDATPAVRRRAEDDAATLRVRDDVFPDVLASVQAVLDAELDLATR
jgi:1,4-alpha-glucan branching enzyme